MYNYLNDITDQNVHVNNYNYPLMKGCVGYIDTRKS